MSDGRRRLEVPTRVEGLLGTGSLPNGYSECILIVGQSNGTLTVAPDLGSVGVVNMAVFGSMVDAWNPVTGTSYEAAVAQVGAMTVREIWDNQGEADSTSAVRAAAYKAKKEAEYAAFRAKFGANLRIRSTLLTTASQLAHAATVRAAQQAIVDEQEHTYGFDLSPYQLADDGLHFGPTGIPSAGPQYVAIGLALGAEFVAAQGGT